jgi:hypothetical protein
MRRHIISTAAAGLLLAATGLVYLTSATVSGNIVFMATLLACSAVAFIA